MREIPGKASRRQIAEAMFQQAVALWGQEHAQALRPTLDQMANHLWMLSTNIPHQEVEPGLII